MYENYQLALIVTFATLDILLKPIMLKFICFIATRNIIDQMCTYNNNNTNNNKVNLYSAITMQIYSTALLEKGSMLGQCQIIYQVMYN